VLTKFYVEKNGSAVLSLFECSSSFSCDSIDFFDCSSRHISKSFHIHGSKLTGLYDDDFPSFGITMMIDFFNNEGKWPIPCIALKRWKIVWTAQNGSSMIILG